MFCYLFAAVILIIWPPTITTATYHVFEIIHENFLRNNISTLFFMSMLSNEAFTEYNCS